MRIKVAVLVGVFSCLWVAVSALPRHVRSGDPEVEMDTIELITSKGYPCEHYDVLTSDNYILTIHRMPHGKNNSALAEPRPVVLLMHPLLSSSACWVENLENESLAFIMADAGFDVFMGNVRGNTYSRRHVTLTTDDDDFWAFSWDEMALYDLPATIDKVLEVSGADDLFYVGHSQGGLIGFTGLSANPATASKVKMFAALAPAVHVKDMQSPLHLLAPLSSGLYALANLVGATEFLSHGTFYTIMAEHFCALEAPGLLCENILFTIAGYNEASLNVSRIPVYVGHHPAGTSVRNLAHFGQMVQNDAVRMFDFGRRGNRQFYNQDTAPLYNISNLEVPVAMFHGTNDWLVAKTNIYKLQTEIPNLVFKKELEGWEHLDFIWAMDAPSLCYADVIRLFKEQLAAN